MKQTTQLDLLDAAILTAMAARPSGAFTYVIRNVLVHEHGYRDMTAGKVRRRLERMERAGTITCKRWGPGCHNEWRRI